MSSNPLDLAVVPPSERRRAPDPTLAIIIVVVVACVVLGGQLVMSGMSEGYCMVWPSIGTRYATAYSDRSFSRVEPGMTREQAVAILGSPLSTGSRPAPSGMTQWQRGDETWQYAQDSSARGGDWAWLSREVVFRDGIVVQKVRWIYYD